MTCASTVGEQVHAIAVTVVQHRIILAPRGVPRRVLPPKARCLDAGIEVIDLSAVAAATRECHPRTDWSGPIGIRLTNHCLELKTRRCVARGHNFSLRPIGVVGHRQTTGAVERRRAVQYRRQRCQCCAEPYLPPKRICQAHVLSRAATSAARRRVTIVRAFTHDSLCASARTCGWSRGVS